VSTRGLRVLTPATDPSAYGCCRRRFAVSSVLLTRTSYETSRFSLFLIRVPGKTILVKVSEISMQYSHLPFITEANFQKFFTHARHVSRDSYHPRLSLCFKSLKCSISASFFVCVATNISIFCKIRSVFSFVSG